MIRTMLLFNIIKFNFKILINLPSLHFSNHSKQFDEKKPKNLINQSIKSNYLSN